MIFLVDVKDLESIADQNNQRNYKPPPIKFINIFFGLIKQQIQKRTKGYRSA
jgi:hypothetical protein